MFHKYTLTNQRTRMLLKLLRLFTLHGISVVGAKALHTRNVYQVLGLDLNTPSEFVVCYADVDKHNNVIGGTATAVNIAKEVGIPVYNISVKEQLDALVDIL